MSRLLRMAFAGFVALSVGASAVASCLPGDPGPNAEMACCLDGHDCGPRMTAADCCPSPTASAEKFVTTKPAASVKPIVALSFVPVTGPVAVSVHSRSSANYVALLTSSSPPFVLPLTSLRI